MRSTLLVVALLALGICAVSGCASNSATLPASSRPGAMMPMPKTETESGFDSIWRTSMGWLTGKNPLAAVGMMEDQSSADQRRKGIYALVERDFGQREPYTHRYRQIAASDGDFTVRAAAIRALNWSRDAGAAPTFIAALNDESELVRWEAAKGLANVPDATAVDPLTRVLGNASETKSTRIAAANALRHYKNLSAARALVNTLEGKDFGVAWQARRSLVQITNHDLKYDERAWLEYLSSNQKPL